MIWITLWNYRAIVWMLICPVVFPKRQAYMLLEFVCLAPSSSFMVGSPMAVGSNSCVVPYTTGSGSSPAGLWEHVKLLWTSWTSGNNKWIFALKWRILKQAKYRTPGLLGKHTHAHGDDINAERLLCRPATGKHSSQWARFESKYIVKFAKDSVPAYQLKTFAVFKCSRVSALLTGRHCC